MCYNREQFRNLKAEWGRTTWGRHIIECTMTVILNIIKVELNEAIRYNEKTHCINLESLGVLWDTDLCNHALFLKTATKAFQLLYLLKLHWKAKILEKN